MSAAVRRLMVDTGAESTWINATVLESIWIERRRKDLQISVGERAIRDHEAGR